MIAELISTGSELLLGQVVNTNAQYISARLAELGIHLFFQTTVGDNRVRMEKALSTALGRADIVITTGGLGPTLGDITKEVSSGVFGRTLELHEESLKRIQAVFAYRGLKMTENNIRQAMIPQGAIVLPNNRGTAPGVVMEEGNKIIINLPGPPYEMQGMFEDAAVPYLTAKYGLKQVIYSRVLRCFGLGESSLEEEIKDLLKQQSNPTIALLAREREIHIRLTALADDVAQADSMLGSLEEVIRTRIGQYIFAVNEDTLAKVAGNLLVERKCTVACAESCTGGMIAAMFTDVPGSSAYFVQGVVTYTNEAKIKLLKVKEHTISRQGAVSEQTAREMAEGVRSLAGTDVGLSVTGIAGPGGATEAKPVGLVYIGVAMPDSTSVYKYVFSGDRSSIRLYAAKTALDLLRRNLLRAGT
ncbi:MAG: competence/damage-inducible protein A [Bacillota bacterium]